MYNGAGNVSSHLSTSSNSGGGGGSTPRNNPAIPYPIHTHQVYQPVMIPVPPAPRTTFSASISGGVGGIFGGDDDGDFARRDERFTQWGIQETRDFTEIRNRLEWEYAASKRNNNLWETVANEMREKGYLRTPDQCKWKWKNLICRYKGRETSNSSDAHQFPFSDEMDRVFTARADRTQQQQPRFDSDMNVVKGRKRSKYGTGDQSHEECSEVQEGLETEGEIVVPKRRISKEKQNKAGKKEGYCFPAPANTNDSVGAVNSLMEIMRNFIHQQQRMDMQWMKQMEKQAEERALFEEEWRRKMEKLERERLMMAKTRWERTEQRRVREEERAEKRDGLLTALLNKLIHEESF